MVAETTVVEDVKTFLPISHCKSKQVAPLVVSRNKKKNETCLRMLARSLSRLARQTTTRPPAAAASAEGGSVGASEKHHRGSPPKRTQTLLLGAFMVLSAGGMYLWHKVTMEHLVEEELRQLEEADARRSNSSQS